MENSTCMQGYLPYCVFAKAVYIETALKSLILSSTFTRNFLQQYTLRAVYSVLRHPETFVQYRHHMSENMEMFSILLALWEERHLSWVDSHHKGSVIRTNNYLSMSFKGATYWSMPGLKLIHVSKRVTRRINLPFNFIIWPQWSTKTAPPSQPC